MPSNSEMYERGALDADHDDLNLFYYQHYYYYRKGYDEARKRSRRPAQGEQSPARRTPLLIGLAVALVTAALGLWWYSSLAPGVEQTTLSAPTTLVPTVRPTVRPTPSPTVAPTSTPRPELAVGRRARVTTEDGAPLRMRNAPSPAGRLLARVPAASEVELLEGPVEVEGYEWWRVRASENEGWCAARALDGSVTFLEPLP